MYFSFSVIFSFLAIFQVKQCLCLIFHVFIFSRNIPCPTVCISHFPPFSVFLNIFLSNSVCISFFALFSFLTIVFFSFFTFLNVSRHIPGPTVCAFHFPKLSISRHIPGPTVRIFLAIIQVLHCVFLFFHVFQCYLPYFTSYSVHFSFSTLFSVSRHIPGQTIFVFHFSRISVFSP